MNKKLIALLFTFQITSLFAWNDLGTGGTNLELNPLRFTNRARCAADSKKPTESAFVMVNNMAPAKAIYRLAKLRGEDTTELTKYGIEVYRYSVLQMIQLIHSRLMNRELPLLPADSTREKMHVAGTYKNIMQSCRLDEYCHELDEYIKKIWTISSMSINPISKVLKYYKVDNFHSKDSYVLEKNFENRTISDQLNCHYVKKFSPLQAHLFGTKPTREVFQQMAKAALESDQYLASCNDLKAQENLEVALYQMEIPALKSRRWKDKGFDYWNSMKVYLSWAFRFAPEMEQMAAPFNNIFKGVALEDSVMLVSNGCKSIAPPKCDGNNLAKNVIREFAKEDFAKDALNLDVLSSVPEGPQNDLIENPIPSINIDELDLGAFPSASEWLKAFKDNFSGTRTVVKNRLIKTLNFLRITKSKLSKEKLLTDLATQFETLSSGFYKEANSDLKNELYYLCAEFYFSSHEEYSFLKKKLEILRKTKLIDGIADQINPESTTEYFSYFEDVSKLITKGCHNLRQKEIWDDSFTLKKEGFAKWYTKKVYDGKVKSKREELREESLKSNTPYLYYGQFEEDSSLDNVICVNASDCARKLVESMVGLHSVAQYANTFFNLEQKIKSPDLFNPYAERTACKVYDPWFKTKSMVFNLIWDIGQAALSATVPGMLYTRAELQPRMVTSFNQMVKDGVIEYDTKYQKEKILLSLAADFGPMLGVPCSVTLNTNARSPYDVYRFNGISVGACNSSENHVLNVRNASDMDPNTGTGHSECVTCQLNFETVSTSVAYAAQNLGPTFFLFRGLVRLFKSLKDPFNIPRTWEANPKYVLETYRRFGDIPKNCVSSLRKGRRCLKTECEEDVAKKVERLMNGHIMDMKMTRMGQARVKLNSCNDSVKVRVYSDANDFFDDSCSTGRVTIPSSCKKALKEGIK